MNGRLNTLLDTNLKLSQIGIQKDLFIQYYSYESYISGHLLALLLISSLK